MVKELKKPQGNPNTSQISPNLTSKLDSKLSKIKGKKGYKPTPKSRQQIYQENYQKNKEKKKQQRRERYQQDKENIKAQQKEKYAKKKQEAQQQAKEQLSKYYEAEAIKILMSLKEYTELNSVKHKLWLDFIWTLKDLNKIGISNIIEVMRIRELAESLINDYWETARNEIKKGKSWNSLDQAQKDRLIRYWGYEKARIENNYLDAAEQLEKQSQEYLKEIEMAKFHEERGKKGCKCWQCEQKAVIQKEVKAKINKGLKELEEQEADNEKGKCVVCGKWKVLIEETEACKKCSEDYGN